MNTKMKSFGIVLALAAFAMAQDAAPAAETAAPAPETAAVQEAAPAEAAPGAPAQDPAAVTDGNDSGNSCSGSCRDCRSGPAA